MKCNGIRETVPQNSCVEKMVAMELVIGRFSPQIFNIILTDINKALLRLCGTDLIHYLFIFFL